MRPQMVGALAAAVVAILVASIPAAADDCPRQLPDQAEDARGYTFIATVARIAPRESDNGTNVTFDVERVFATKDDPESNPLGLVLQRGSSIRVVSDPCNGIRSLQEQERYLVSTSQLSAPDGPTSAVWRIDGERLSLVRMFRFLGDERLAEATNLATALALVAPDATLPPTDTAGSQGDPGMLGGLILAAAAAIGAGLGWRLRRTQAA